MKARHIVWSLVCALVPGTLAYGDKSAQLKQRYRDQIRQQMARPETFGPAHLDIVEGLPVLHLYGTPEEMGRQYGTILKPALAALDRYSQIAAPPAWFRVLQTAAMRREPRLSDRYRRELKAVAEASGLSYETLVTANLTPRFACTVLLAWGKATKDGSVIFARNGEYYTMGLSDCGSVVTVWHPKEGMPQLSLNFLGMIGTFSGANEAGLCFGNLLAHNARDPAINEKGLPIQFVLRAAGERFTTVEEMKTHLLKQPPLIPVQVAMADAKQPCIVELSTPVRTVRKPDKDYLAAATFFHGKGRREDPAPNWIRRRYQLLVDFARERYGRIDEKNVTQALFAARAGRAFNMHSVVFVPGRMKMYASFNRSPAAAGPFVELDLKTLFSAPPATVPQAPPSGQSSGESRSLGTHSCVE